MLRQITDTTPVVQEMAIELFGYVYYRKKLLTKSIKE